MPDALRPPQQPRREVPAHQVLTLKPKTTRFCVVVPVINEGARIQAQLVRMHGLGLMTLCDVVIADGGSTDGSLDEAFLRANGVAALLVKTGPGRQSAQLRMAFAWALDQGYDGIVTVDGNSKDGVEAVPAFVQKLQEGFDFVQGSRYVPGGVALNTPLDRTLAVRLVHAPLISLAAGRRFTDTTNGFRAFSARLLADPRMAVFRDVFRNYNLFFYLAIRAARLGFRTCEIPVFRAYPSAGKPPSKISGMKGRLLLLKELLLAVAGAYDP